MQIKKNKKNSEKINRRIVNNSIEIHLNCDIEKMGVAIQNFKSNL